MRVGPSDVSAMTRRGPNVFGMHDSSDVIVIGAGIFGCGISFELARRGHRVTTVEMLPGPGQGSTSSSGAIVRFMYSTVDGVRLAWEGNRYWEAFADYLEVPEEAHESGVARKVTTGLWFLRLDDDLHARYVHNLSEAGVEFEDCTPDEVLERFPFMTLDTYGGPASPDDERFFGPATGSYGGALYTPDAGYVNDPMLAARNLATAAEAKGACFRYGCRVESIRTEADGASRRVRGVELTTGETIDAPIVVAVGGPWSSRLVDMAGLTGTMNITTAPMRHEAHVAPAPPGVDFDAEGAIIADLDVGTYYRPEAGNQIFVGSTDPEVDGHDWVDDLDVMNREITRPIAERQMMRTARRFPDFGVPHTPKGVAEAYDVSTDWGPVYDRTDVDGLYVAMGTSGNQFKNACVASHLMAELVEAVEGGLDHDRTPLVVEGRYTGVPIDMGSFSRNRSVNTDSTGSVLG